MSDRIGVTAGQTWAFLCEQGPSSANQIQKRIGADAALTNQAIGWLAREGKLNIDRSKRTVLYSLSE